MSLLALALLSCAAEPEEQSALSLGPVVACEAPSALAYVDVAQQLGFEEPASELEHGDGGGLLLADVDRDGTLDLMHSYSQGAQVVLDVQGQPRLQRLLVGGPYSQVQGVLLVSFDSLYVGGLEGGIGAPLMERIRGAVVRSPSVGDFDGDSYTDLFAPLGHPETAELRRDWVLWGSETGFHEQQVPVDETGEGFDSQILDWDGDGWMDVYVDNDRGSLRGQNRLYRGGPDGLEDVTERCGACGLGHSGMGAHSADINGDGWADLLLAGTSENEILWGSAAGQMIQAPHDLGLAHMGPDGMTWGAVIGDVDNDGSPDLWMASGDQGHDGILVGAPSPAYLYLQQPDASFLDAAPDLGLDGLGSWRSVMLYYLNGDGVLDLLQGSSYQRPRVWMSQGCTQGAWLEIEAPEGSRVDVQAGGRAWVGWVGAEQGYASSGPLRLHLGLGEAARVEHLTVQLPAGGAVSELSDFEARRVVRLER